MIPSVLDQVRAAYAASLSTSLPNPTTITPPAPGTAAKPFHYACPACDITGVVPAGEPLTCWCCDTDELVAR